MVSGHASPAAIYTVIFTSITLAISAVALRLYTRYAILGKVAQDDILMTAALVSACAFTICQALETHHGLGRHLSDLNENERTKALRDLWISILLYHAGTSMARLSIVSQCIKVFGSIHTFKIVAWIITATVLVYTAWTILITIFVCQPVDFFWQRVQPGRCLPRLPVWFFNSAFGVATDMAVALLPLPVVHRLRVPKRQKYLLMVVFALGGAVCLVTIIRFYSLFAVATSEDFTWENPQAALYSNIEISASIIGGCLPTYNAFIAKYFPKLYDGYAGPRGDPLADIELSNPSETLQASTFSCAKTISNAESGQTVVDNHQRRNPTPEIKGSSATLSEKPTMSW